MEAEIATQAVGLTSSTDFSLINLFFRADIVVKSVIIILIWGITIQIETIITETEERLGATCHYLWC